MAANKTVIVLMPNGQRQAVEVSPNTIVLQVLEEACSKHNYNLDEYDVKHFNEVLDVNVVCFAELQNNAELKMIPYKGVDSNNLTIGIRLEGGTRLTGEFQPTDTLQRVLQSLCPLTDFHQAALIYTNRKICGKALQETALTSLGINNGRATFRLVNCDSEQSKSQVLPKFSNVDAIKSTIPQSTSVDASMDTVTVVKVQATELEGLPLHDNTENILGKQKDSIQLKNEDTGNMNMSFSVNLSEGKEQDANIEFLGERNALIFNEAAAQALPQEELPEDFFDLTVNDAKLLLRDVKRMRQELEDAPLLTNAHRQLNDDKRMLNQLHKYKSAIIRIKFPDQFVLQGLFGPLEKVQAIKDFIKNYLDDPNSVFTIYTTPPRHILNPSARLIDEGLVPSAIIYFTGPSFLSTFVKTKMIDPQIAGMEANKYRILQIREKRNSISDEDTSSQVASVNNNPQPAPSGHSSRQSEKKVPKWFKSLK